MITLGLDPHPGSHTVAALDANGTPLASLTVPNTPEGLAQLHAFAAPFKERRSRGRGRRQPLRLGVRRPSGLNEDGS